MAFPNQGRKFEIISQRKRTRSISAINAADRTPAKITPRVTAMKAWPIEAMLSMTGWRVGMVPSTLGADAEVEVAQRGNRASDDE